MERSLKKYDVATNSASGDSVPRSTSSAICRSPRKMSAVTMRAARGPRSLQRKRMT
jgi:hypothetical protein